MTSADLEYLQECINKPSVEVNDSDIYSDIELLLEEWATAMDWN